MSEHKRPLAFRWNEEWTRERLEIVAHLQDGILGRAPSELRRCPFCGGTYYRSNAGLCPRCGFPVERQER